MKNVLVAIACISFIGACPAWAAERPFDQSKASGKSSQQSTSAATPENAKAEANKGLDAKNERSSSSGSLDVNASSGTATVVDLTAPCDTTTASWTAVAASCSCGDRCPAERCCPTAGGQCGCFPFRCP